jgi:hypothetical protein
MQTFKNKQANLNFTKKYINNMATIEDLFKNDFITFNDIEKMKQESEK